MLWRKWRMTLKWQWHGSWWTCGHGKKISTNSCILQVNKWCCKNLWFMLWMNCLRNYTHMYNSETNESIKETNIIFDSRKESRTEVIISTNALGVDFKGLSSIIFFGPLHSILDVLQEIGRAGRDGEKVVALLLTILIILSIVKQ